MALYHKVNGRLVQINSAMDDAIKFAKESVRKGKSPDDVVHEAADMYGLEQYETEELQRIIRVYGR